MSREALFDYFAGEVFDRAAPDQRAVLARTALLPQIDEQVATRLSGVAHAAQVLRELAQRQYFIDRRGGDGSSLRYRYQDLFRDFLGARLEDTLSLAELNELSRASGSRKHKAFQVQPTASAAVHNPPTASSHAIV